MHKGPFSYKYLFEKNPSKTQECSVHVLCGLVSSVGTWRPVFLPGKGMISPLFWWTISNMAAGFHARTRVPCTEGYSTLNQSLGFACASAFLTWA